MRQEEALDRRGLRRLDDFVATRPRRISNRNIALAEGTGNDLARGNSRSVAILQMKRADACFSRKKLWSLMP
jgi:hypothetical protein